MARGALAGCAGKSMDIVVTMFPLCSATSVQCITSNSTRPGGAMQSAGPRRDASSARLSARLSNPSSEPVGPVSAFRHVRARRARTIEWLTRLESHTVVLSHEKRYRRSAEADLAAAADEAGAADTSAEESDADGSDE